MTAEIGSFTLSLDFEMAWGSWRAERWPWDAFASEPDVVRRLDDLAQELRLPFTVGVVGALAAVALSEIRDLDPSVGVDTAFPELSGRYLPGTVPAVGALLERPEVWLNRDVVERLRTSPAGHEVCSHTFFHTLPRLAEALPLDVNMTQQAVGEISTLIFPKDSLGFLDWLPASGLRAYRGTGESAYMKETGKPRKLGRAQHLLEQAIGRPAPLAQVRPGPATGLTTSAYLTLRTGIRRKIPLRSLRRRFVAPLEHAVRRRGNYHLWTHPWNLALPGSDGFDLLAEVLAEAARLRDRGDLRVQTMAQLAAAASEHDAD